MGHLSQTAQVSLTHCFSSLCQPVASWGSQDSHEDSGRGVTLHHPLWMPTSRQAGWQDIGACWHPPETSVYSDKITHRAMSWWGHGGTLYLGVITLTNLLLRLRSSERSKCTTVCQRCNQRVDLGPWQWVWHNECRIIKVSSSFFPQKWKFLFFSQTIQHQHNQCRTTEQQSSTIWTWESVEHISHQGPIAFLFKPTAAWG